MALNITRIGGTLNNMVVMYFINTELYLDPPFQRGSVWTKKQKQAWIETLITDLPRPTIFINYVNDFGAAGPYNDALVVIDGRQRIEAMREFVTNQFPVQGEYYKDQNETFQNRFMMIAMPTVMCQFKTEKECIELYLRLLSCGTQHTDTEIAKAEQMLKEL